MKTFKKGWTFCLFIRLPIERALKNILSKIKIFSEKVKFLGEFNGYIWEQKIFLLWG